MLYGKYFKMHFKSALQYKWNTILLAFSQVIITIGEILGIWLLFKTFKTVGDWGFYESMLMVGIVVTVFGFNECFARGYDEFPKLIKSGQFDRLLVRPVNIYFQIFCSKIEFSKLGRILLGIVVSIIALIKIQIQWTVAKFLVLIATYICGIMVIMGLMFICAGVSVFTVENLEFLNILTDGSKELSFYPINIYKKWLKNIFTFIIPLACFNYLPLSFLMETGNVPMWLCALSPILGLLFFVPCFFFFKFSLTKYQGTGS